MDANGPNRFYYSTTGQDVIGPCEVDELTAALEAGVIPEGTSVCAEGAADWLPIRHICRPARGPVGQTRQHQVSEQSSTLPNNWQPVEDASPYGCAGFVCLIAGTMLTLTGFLAILGVPLMIAGFVLAGIAAARMLSPPRK